ALLILSACNGPAPAPQAREDPMLAASRALADRFQAQLMQALEAAIAADGAAGAVSACAAIAPALAAQLSEESGARVRRTALRVRNPAAAPDAFEEEALNRMAQAPLDADGRPAEVHQALDGGFRYLRAIPTRGLCLQCHGESIAPDVRAAIAATYPADAATGFREGTLRGAFSITWPAGTPGPRAAPSAPGS
ncbi:MAG: DUF3365 domain-containing protein, partial [Sphingomonadaceae bacterium]